METCIHMTGLNGVCSETQKVQVGCDWQVEDYIKVYYNGDHCNTGLFKNMTLEAKDQTSTGSLDPGFCS